MTPAPAGRRPAVRAAALGLVGLLAWVAGAALGAAPAARRAAAAPPFLQVGRAHAEFTPVLDGSEPIFVVVIGSDARPGQPVDRERADSIHLVGIDPARGRASILGFPRDSWVEIPGHGSDKINASMVYGGPEAVVATVEALTGITVDYWALTSFEGFQAMVNDVGGLVVDVPVPMSDPSARSDFEPGVQRLDGADALAFARDRHSLASGDFGRSENQGRLLLAALAQFRKEFAKDPSRLLTWVAAGLRHVQTDLGIGEVLDLAFTATAINPKRVPNMVVPGSTGMEGGQSVVFLSSAAVAIYRDMADDGFVSKANVPPSPELG